MRESDFIFQSISVRRRVIIAIGFLTVLIVVVGLYGLIAVVESNHRLHQSILEEQRMAEAIDTARLSQVHFKKQVQEWKNILLRGNDKTRYEFHLKAFHEEEKMVNDYLQSLSRTTASIGLSVPQIAGLIKAHEELGRQYREALKKYQHHDLKSAVLVDQSIRGIDRKLTDEIDDLVKIIMDDTAKKLKDKEMKAKTQMEAYQALAVFIIVLIVAGIGIGIFNAWSITKELPPGANEQTDSVDEQ